MQILFITYICIYAYIKKINICHKYLGIKCICVKRKTSRKINRIYYYTYILYIITILYCNRIYVEYSYSIVMFHILDIYIYIYIYVCVCMHMYVILELFKCLSKRRDSRNVRERLRV